MKLIRIGPVRLSKLTLFRMGVFGAAHGCGGLFGLLLGPS